MKNHPLHLKIGEKLESLFNLPHYILLIDPACGGHQYISLFINKMNRENAMCKVDAMIVKDTNILAIIEIEESGLNPTKICGKYLAAALSKFYIHNGVKYSLSKDTAFFQIIDISKLNKQNTSKKEQTKYIEKSIQSINSTGIIKNYSIDCIDGNDDEITLSKIVKKIIAVQIKFRKSLKTIADLSA